MTRPRRLGFKTMIGVAWGLALVAEGMILLGRIWWIALFWPPAVAIWVAAYAYMDQTSRRYRALWHRSQAIRIVLDVDAHHTNTKIFPDQPTRSVTRAMDVRVSDANFLTDLSGSAELLRLDLPNGAIGRLRLIPATCKESRCD